MKQQLARFIEMGPKGFPLGSVSYTHLDVYKRQKKPLPGTLAGRPVHSVLDEALAPVDRDCLLYTSRCV